MNEYKNGIKNNYFDKSQFCNKISSFMFQFTLFFYGFNKIKILRTGDYIEDLSIWFVNINNFFFLFTYNDLNFLRQLQK